MSKSKIINNLYIGNYTTALYESNDFDIVINCTNNIPMFKDDQSKCIRIPIADTEDFNDDLLHHLPSVTEIIHKNIDKKILVHCQQGSSRSASVVCAYLIRYYKMSVTDAVEYVKSKRQSALHTLVFIRALNSYNDVK
jgi:protein-tyrosine phosphatase